MQIHGPNEVVREIPVRYWSTDGAVSLEFPGGLTIVLEDAEDDLVLINAIAEVRRLRAIDARLVPPAPYDLPLSLVGGEA